jgi:enoyl-CoA hydratase/carnithine racemase
VRCVILTGAGTAFCAGGDLKAMRDKRGIMEGSHADLRENYRRGVQRMANALYDCDAPTVAAVNGPAIGLGLDVACMCDIRIASEKASFAESFIKVGIVPGDGGAWLLPRVVGMSAALEMSFTGETIDAQAALAARLVSRVVPEGELMAAARDLARRIAANPPDALRMTKRLLREGQYMRLSSLLELSASYQALAHSTEDHKEAVNAMLEKRRPVLHRPLTPAAAAFSRRPRCGGRAGRLRAPPAAKEAEDGEAEPETARNRRPRDARVQARRPRVLVRPGGEEPPPSHRHRPARSRGVARRNAGRQPAQPRPDEGEGAASRGRAEGRRDGCPGTGIGQRQGRKSRNAVPRSRQRGHRRPVPDDQGAACESPRPVTQTGPASLLRRPRSRAAYRRSRWNATALADIGTAAPPAAPAPRQL